MSNQVESPMLLNTRKRTKKEQEILNQQLYQASRDGDNETVTKLLDKGADINYVYSLSGGLTVLGGAAAKGHTETVRLLISKKELDINKRDRSIWEMNALHWSCLKGHIKCSRLLVDAGIDLQAIANNGWNAMHWVCVWTRFYMIKYLLENGLSLDLPKDKWDGKTPRMKLDETREDVKQFLEELKSQDNTETPAATESTDTTADYSTTDQFEDKKVQPYDNDRITEGDLSVHKDRWRNQRMTEDVASQEEHHESQQEVSSHEEGERKDEATPTETDEGEEDQLKSKEGSCSSVDVFERSTGRDVSIQFDYWVPMKDLLYGATVVDETVFNVHGDQEQTFNWTECGFSLHIPTGSLDRIETCPVAVKALISGRFKFPKGFQLLSALYAISPGRKFKKKIEMSIQHCFLIEREDQLRRLRFIKACATSNPNDPYVFEYVDGGIFTIGDQYCHLQQNGFSIYGAGEGGTGQEGSNPSSQGEHGQQQGSEGVGANEGYGDAVLESSTSSTHDDHHDPDEDVPATIEEMVSPDNNLTHRDDSEYSNRRLEEGGVSVPNFYNTPFSGGDFIPIKYRAHFYYEEIGQDSWDLELVAVQELKAHIKYVNNHLRKRKKCESFQFFFLDQPDPAIHFQFTDEQKNNLPNGWFVKPLLTPCCISKEEVDTLSFQEQRLQSSEEEIVIPDIPTRTVCVFADSSCTISHMEYQMGIEGIKDTKTFRIIRRLDQTNGGVLGNQPHRTNTSETVLQSQELNLDYDCNGVVIALTPVHHIWEKLGRYLNIPDSIITSIANKYNNDPFKQMSDLISTWIRRPTKEHHPSLRVLYQALVNMGEAALAEKITKDTIPDHSTSDQMSHYGDIMITDDGHQELSVHEDRQNQQRMTEDITSQEKHHESPQEVSSHEEDHVRERKAETDEGEDEMKIEHQIKSKVNKRKRGSQGDKDDTEGRLEKLRRDGSPQKSHRSEKGGPVRERSRRERHTHRQERSPRERHRQERSLRERHRQEKSPCERHRQERSRSPWQSRSRYDDFKKKNKYESEKRILERRERPHYPCDRRQQSHSLHHHSRRNHSKERYYS